MDYQGDIFRPPSEAKSILLQVTTGCSHNKCTFCSMYKNSRFSIKDEKTILADIDYAADHFSRLKRLFLCDGDALIVPQKKLLTILDTIGEKLPWLERRGIYANAKSIAMKSLEELRELHEHGLDIAYLGLESGDDQVLKAVNKGADSAQMIKMARKVKDAGIKLSVTVLLGLGGKEHSLDHAKNTGRVLSQIDPEYVGALSIMLDPGTPLYEQHEKGEFTLPDAQSLLQELRVMIEHTEMSDGYFHANHASNYLPVKAKLPFDKKETLKLLDDALAGKVSLKPEYARGF